MGSKRTTMQFETRQLIYQDLGIILGRRNISIIEQHTGTKFIAYDSSDGTAINVEIVDEQLFALARLKYGF